MPILVTAVEFLPDKGRIPENRDQIAERNKLIDRLNAAAGKEVFTQSRTKYVTFEQFYLEAPWDA